MSIYANWSKSSFLEYWEKQDSSITFDETIWADEDGNFLLHGKKYDTLKEAQAAAYIAHCKMLIEFVAAVEQELGVKIEVGNKEKWTD